MKRTAHLFLITFLFTTGFSWANTSGDDPVLMTIGGKPVTKSEFLAIFLKNNKSQTIDQKALNEYVDLFVNFKLKVREAESMGMDTVTAFRKELDGYRRQLAQPYLTDKETTEALQLEAYERMKTDVRASHILIMCDGNALPKDTLAAYNKAMEARKELLKGTRFADVARKYSGDPSAKDNGGDLGYFTALQMVYPFETAAYKAEINVPSMPVRTSYGYHILLVNDKRPNQGQLTAAHIMVKAAKGINAEDSLKAKLKIDELYQKVKAGESFADLAAQYSDDKGSAKKGGELPMFGTGKMVLEFEKAAFALKNDGDISEPVKTVYGWHIIKRIKKTELESYEQLKNEIKNKVAKDSRTQKSKESMIARIKKEYAFTEDLKMRDAVIKTLDTTYFEGAWKSKDTKLAGNLFKIADKQFTQKDFITYVETHQVKRVKTDLNMAGQEAYKAFVKETLLAYEEERLPMKYPEYKALLQEYRDGILLFDLTDKMVWSKAVKDSSGLTAYYDQNKSKYMWPERCQVTVYECSDAATAGEVQKLITRKKRPAEDELIKTMNKESQLKLKIEHHKFVKGDQRSLDSLGWKPGISPVISSDKKHMIFEVEKVIQPEIKTLQECRGVATADYQNFLEQQWIAGLRSKYPVSIDREALNAIR